MDEELKALKDSLFINKKNGYDRLSVEDRLAMDSYCSCYMNFLDNSRTEQEAVVNAIAEAEDEGFVEYQPEMELKAGDKIYFSNRGKSLMLAVIGKKPLSEGVVIAGAHIDSPRLDLKQNPLFEQTEMAYLRTHYYGGIKKYQWVTIPLELHGVVCLKTGETVPVCIGRDPDDPKFVITDLLPHLAQEQVKKTLEDGITGEGLQVLIGSVPYAGEGSDRVKLAIMSLLNDEYGFTEEDFLSAELTAVPGFDVCDVGLDRSMIGGYGQDDRVCAYAELKALFDLREVPERTCVCLLVDKEETGSDGVSSMQSAAFDGFMEDLCESQGVALRHCFRRSFCISADVTTAYDPLYPEVFEKQNAFYLNYGVGVCKSNGSRGKYSTSDAGAELVAYLRRVFDENDVAFQVGELGAVDHGGGGTIAKYMANRNISTIDAGVPVLSMHAPFEVTGKLDCYMTYKGMLAVYSAKD